MLQGIETIFDDKEKMMRKLKKNPMKVIVRNLWRETVIFSEK